MQLNFLKVIYKWTVRIIIPVFIFTQLFIACHAAYAADQHGITVTGDTILLDKTVSGDVTIINPKPVTTAQAKQIIFSILEMQGFTIVRYDNYVKVVRSGEAKTLPIKTLRPAKNAL